MLPRNRLFIRIAPCLIVLLVMSALAFGVDVTKLRVALQTGGISEDETDKAKAVLDHVFESHAGWFEEVDVSEKPDVSVKIRRHVIPDRDIEMWKAGVESDAEPLRERSFPNTLAIETFLMLDLQRHYIIKNVAAVQSTEVDIEFTTRNAQKATYREGEEIAFSFFTPVDGFLNVIVVTCDGKVDLLFPFEGESNFVEGNRSINLPRDEMLSYTVQEPFGPEYVKAIFSTVPVDLSILTTPHSWTRGIPKALQEIQTRSVDSGEEDSRVEGNRIGTTDIYYQTEAATSNP